ncbi:hypothetical protein BJV77DRAFT_1072004 [Russula vinacea]|nr:hypothetical protein BJV77DRAFT_1072004 [Russula vinacea]
MSNSAPTQCRRDKREWTTYEQKAHLQSKQGGYVLARDQRNLRTWLGIELEVYFNRFPTQPVTKEEMVLHGQTWSVQEKQLLQEKVPENDSSSSCDSRKLSDAQRFSKLYYIRRYKKLVTKTWQDFYLAHYERVKEDVAEVDATERDKVVRDSIREDLRAGVLDSVPTKVLGAEEDVEDEDITKNNEDQEERGDEGTGIRTRTRDPQASRSQQNAVEEHKMKEDGEEMDDSDNEVEVGDGDKHVKRLNRLLRFVFMDTSSILELTSLTFSSRRSAMEYTVIRLLDQIFKETGLVGTIIAPLVNSPNQAPYMEIASESCGVDFSDPFAAAMWDTAFADAMPPEKDTQVEAATLDKAAQVITSTQVLTSATLDTSASPHVSASPYVSASPASPRVTASPRTSAPAPTTPAIEEDILTQPATKSKSQTSATVRQSKRHASPGANAAELDASSNARPALPSMLPVHLPLFVVLIPPQPPAIRGREVLSSRPPAIRGREVLLRLHVRNYDLESSEEF